MIETCDTPGLLPIKAAISTMLNQVTPITECEQLDLEEALGRVLTSDVLAHINVPPNDNSAMDGYAMRADDLKHTNQLLLAGNAMAGTPFEGEVQSGQCIRIMTGAVIPQGADAVVMQENTQAQGEHVVFNQQPATGNSVRKAGEDIQQGQVVVAKGTCLGAAHLALIASVGIAEVTVFRQLKIGLIATGDELTAAGDPLPEGNIYESNRYALRALLSSFPVQVFDFGIIKDDKSSLTEAFTQAGDLCDLVITCGGVSVGDADYVKGILEQLGSVNFWKVAIKPGKPFAFGQIGQAWFCGLPGNPVSSYVTFEQLVTPVLRQLSGQSIQPAPYFVARAACIIRKRPGRADYQRGIFYRDDHGELWVKPNGKQGSGIMSSIANANCYMLLDQGSGDVAQGEKIKIEIF